MEGQGRDGLGSPANLGQLRGRRNQAEEAWSRVVSRDFCRDRPENPGWETAERSRCPLRLIGGSFLRSLALATNLNPHGRLQDTLVKATVRSRLSPGAQPGRKLRPRPKGSAGAGLPRVRLREGTAPAAAASLLPSRKRKAPSYRFRGSGAQPGLQDHLCQDPRPQKPELHSFILKSENKVVRSAEDLNWGWVYLILPGAVHFGCLPLPGSSHLSLSPLSAHLSRLPSKYHLPPCPCKPRTQGPNASNSCHYIKISEIKRIKKYCITENPLSYVQKSMGQRLKLWNLLKDHKSTALHSFGGKLIYIVKFIDVNGEGNGNPLQYSCLENPIDRGAW